MYHTHRYSLAPLSLCSVQGFDLKDRPAFCPPERDALADVFNNAKGNEWTESVNGTIDWLDEYASHCQWYGVSCEYNQTTKLVLSSNGLSGRLSSSIGNLPSLKHLDLSDNDIKVGFP